MTNRLISEKSPYLLQHATNPVEWYPWGAEAFSRADAEDRPVFLSIGYSTCHWCHVMERESFEDPEVAGKMNEAFVCVKVDREERPDLDHIYMMACQLLTGSGGWPLTIIMTPDRKPFFAGTYIPKQSRFGRTGMMELIPRIAELWANRRTEAVDAADEITAALKDFMSTSPGTAPGREVVTVTFDDLSRRYDDRYGGFGRAPKFPVPGNLLFLLRHWRRTGSSRALEMVEGTLRAMRRGGIYDHIGFGFHRYSTDSRWLLPHFEKMLYDQALLAMAYTEAYQAAGREEYKRTAREIFTYVLRDMTDPEGGFYCAEDADSEGVEGKFYTWTSAEIDSLIDPSEAAVIREVFQIRDEGNFKPETGEPSRENILHLDRPLSQAASELGLEVDDLTDAVSRIRDRLFTERNGRVRPGRDDKILTDWNGLMIAALAKGASALGEERYGRSAEKAAGFILRQLRGDDGRLLHRYRDGESAIPGNLDDYSFLTWGLIELYHATFKPEYLEEALRLTEDSLTLFWDDIHGGFYFTSGDSGSLPFRFKTGTDGAIPSGNAVAAMNLLRLARMTANSRLEEKADRVGQAFSREVSHHPSAYTTFVTFLDMARSSSVEVVVVGEPEAADTRNMISRLRSAYHPDVTIVLVSAVDPEPIVRLAPFTAGMKAIEDRATAYVCREFTCQSPTTDIDAVLSAVEGPEEIAE
jgi:uncharacterized protein YyaL (SSP411 family)